MNTPAARRVQRAFSRAAGSYDAAAEIQRQVVGELIARLPADDPHGEPVGTLLDLGCGTGFAFPLLTERYPSARLIGLDFAENMLRHAPTGPNLQRICGRATLLPFSDASIDLIVCSLTFQWCPLDAALSEAWRVLRPGGQLAFSTLTEHTFKELHHAFAGLDDAPHALPMLSPQDIAGAVEAAGFVSPETLREPRVARFPDARALFDSIRQTGASEVTAGHEQNDGSGRRRGLLGKAAYATILTRLAGLADGSGQVPLTYDVFYLSARKPGGGA